MTKPIEHSKHDAEVYADLVASEERFRRIVELSNDMIVQTDARGNMTYISPSIEHMLGYRPEQMLNQSLVELVHSADKAAAFKAFENVIKGAASARVIVRARHANGIYVWVEALAQLALNDEGVVVGTYAIVRDISYQYNAIQQLRDLNRQLETFKLAAEASFNHIVITDAEGKITFANQSAARITQYSIQEMLGQTPGLWGRQMSKKFWDTIKSRKLPFHGELINRRKDGTLYSVVATVSPILGAKDRLIGFIGVEEDISMYKNPRELIVQLKHDGLA